MNVVVKLAEWVPAVAVLVLVVFLEKLSESVHRRREEREAQVCDAQRVLARDKAQTALDAAYALAEQQALAQAETGQGWRMPSREQVAASGCDGAHDRLDPAAVASFGDAFALIADALALEVDCDPG